MDKLGICSWVLPFQEEALFEFVKQAGLCGISMEFDYSVCDAVQRLDNWCEKWRKMAERYEIAIPIMAINTLGEYGMSRAEDYAEVRKILDYAIPSAAAMHIPCVHLPGFGVGAVHSEQELSQTIRCLEYAVKLGEEYKVGIGHETVLTCSQYDKILSEVCSPVFFMLFDNENLMREHQDPVEIYQRYFGKYRHAHIKYSEPQTGIPRPLSENDKYGGIPALLQTLHKANFDGWILLETDYKQLKDPSVMVQMIREDIKFLRETERSFQ